MSNQYTAIGAVKPGLFRRWLVSALLVLIDYACRHVFTCGFLARVQTIHFARWVFIDDKTRVVFTSNYDGDVYKRRLPGWAPCFNRIAENRRARATS